MLNREYYNNAQKEDFINEMVEADKSYISSYERLFSMVQPFEEMHCKDLAVFSSKDLHLVFKSVAQDIKYTTALTYNSLVGEYKGWMASKGKSIVNEICTVDELQNIKDFKEYFILNDRDMLRITKYATLDGGDYNIALALKLFWDIDGQEDILDVLKLRLEDIHAEEKAVTIHRTIYQTVNRKRTIIGTKPYKYYLEDSWVINSLLEYADLEEIYFKKKRGSYKILSAEQNDGLVFRMTFTKRVKKGEPIDGVKFSNTLYQFCTRNKLTEVITINDILASLALRYMLKYMKSPAEMYTSKRYFQNTPSSVYAEIFRKNASKKYPNEYAKYVEYYRNLENEFVSKQA